MAFGLGLGLGLGFGGQSPTQRKKMDTKYLFIDGGCLRATIRNIKQRYFGGNSINIDYSRLKSDHKKAFYYDAIPAIKLNESDEDYGLRTSARVQLHNHIATLLGYHVYEGDSRIRRKQVQQKEVDVMIAVDMLTHTFRGNMDRATFIASDIDFKPLLDALVREGMFVELCYPPSDTNQDLVNAADHRTPLAIEFIYNILDRKSRDLLELPQRSQMQKSDFDEGESRVVLNHPSLGEVRYKLRDGKHILYWGYPENIDNFIEVRSSDYGILKKYVEDIYLIRIPDE